jgi:apolipoprotein N-acyltransferase
MSFARLRAIENRRSVARSANTGISCFINQRGDVVKRSKWWEPIALKETINLNNDTTMYTKYGDVIGRSFAFVSALILLLTFTRAFKRIFTR